MMRRRNPAQEAKEMERIVAKVKRDMEGAEFYTVREVARLLRTSRQTVLRWVRQGLIPGIRIGRTIRIPKDQMDKILFGEGGSL